MLDAVRQFEICQEARFVLWALRCAIATGRGDTAAPAELARGFELADVPETAASFQQLSGVLGAMNWSPEVWHHPRCSCVSNEEMLILRTLAETAAALRRGDPRPARTWQALVPLRAVGALDLAARAWLAVLQRAGVVFPQPAELMECLEPLESLVEPAPRMAQVH